MNKGFIKFNRSEDSKEIIKRPNELALLALIAWRAKRTNSISVLGLEPGEALIGDYKSCGLTQQKYRTAKKNLEKWGIITTKATNKGTIAKIINTKVFDVNIETANDRIDETITDGQRSSNDQPTTNEECNKEKKEEEREERQSPPSPGTAGSGFASEEMYTPTEAEFKKLRKCVKGFGSDAIDINARRDELKKQAEQIRGG